MEFTSKDGESIAVLLTMCQQLNCNMIIRSPGKNDYELWSILIIGKDVSVGPLPGQRHDNCVFDAEGKQLSRLLKNAADFAERSLSAGVLML